MTLGATYRTSIPRRGGRRAGDRPHRLDEPMPLRVHPWPTSRGTLSASPYMDGCLSIDSRKDGPMRRRRWMAFLALLCVAPVVSHAQDRESNQAKRKIA